MLKCFKYIILALAVAVSGCAIKKSDVPPAPTDQGLGG